MHAWSPDAGSLAIPVLRRLYKLRKISPVEVVRAVYRRIAASPHKEAWITLVDESAAIAAAEALDKRAAEHARNPLPLFGIPFAVKDNIDVADMPTTAGCREYARNAATSATAVARLLAAGAILIGKTNLDQFATGLTGVVSSYGICKNPFDSNYVAGGSSAGSALAVAAGLVSFSLGTDTAGSGRIPAGFNNIVGLKPTRGLVPTRGVLPACRSLDCVSVFSLTAGDASEILGVIKGFDHADTYSRAEADGDSASLLRVPVTSFRFGIAPAAQLEGISHETLELYHAAAKHLESLGGKRFEVSIAPLLTTGKLLYEGPWIAERLAATADFISQNPNAVNASTRNAILSANNFSAVDTFRAMYELEVLRREASPLWSQIDLLVLPTALEIPTIEASVADPRGVSAKLGRLTNFVNLLDMCAVSVPAGFRAGASHLPFGVTLLGPAFTDASLADLAERFHRLHKITLGATGQNFPEVESIPGGFLASPGERFAEKNIAVAVVGAHLSGQPLNHQLTQLSARLSRRCRTAPIYKLFALETTPPKPGMIRVCGEDKSGGAAIELEVWDMPEKNMGAFMQLVGAPLCIGTITLDTGDSVKGFLCEVSATKNAREITHFGGWLNYLARAK
jgi:allophanate hydrolase